MLNSFRELIVWQKAFALSLKVYKYTEQFPANEKYGLVSQMRRAAVSIVSNIAEGYARSTRKDYAHFLSNSLDSEAELSTQVLLSNELRFLSKDKAEELLANLSETGKILTSIRTKLLVTEP